MAQLSAHLKASAFTTLRSSLRGHVRSFSDLHNRPTPHSHLQEDPRSLRFWRLRRNKDLISIEFSWLSSHSTASARSFTIVSYTESFYTYAIEPKETLQRVESGKNSGSLSPIPISPVHLVSLDR